MHTFPEEGGVMGEDLPEKSFRWNGLSAREFAKIDLWKKPLFNTQWSYMKKKLCDLNENKKKTLLVLRNKTTRTILQVKV